MEVEAEMPLTPGIQPPDTSYHLQHASHRRAAPSLVGQRPDYKTHGLRAQWLENLGKTMCSHLPTLALIKHIRNILSPECRGDSSHPSLRPFLLLSPSRGRKNYLCD